jgi:hypothetical protein
MGSRSRSTQGVRASSATRVFEAVSWLTAFLLAAEIIRANLSNSQQHDWPWKLRLLGIPTTAAILVTSLAVLLLRDQFARSMAPALRYVSHWSSDAHGLSRAAGRYRHVVVRNVGPGTAVIAGVTWRVAAGSGSQAVGVTTMVALRELLTGLGLEDGADYTISNYSQGAALAPGEEREYFECTDSMVAKLAVFDADFAFESLLGDHYHRTTSLLPRSGASDAVAAHTESIG